MSRGGAVRDGWRPATKEDRDIVRDELELVLASPHFCNSKRYPALLRYIVENTLEGRSDLLKERNLGIDVFDRPPTYDTNSDTVVRFTAGEVRKRLALYYHETDRRPTVQITLPVGSYIPEFLHPSEAHGSEHNGDAELADLHHLRGAGSLETSGEHRLGEPLTHLEPGHEAALGEALSPKSHARRGLLIAALVLVCMVVLGVDWQYRAVRAATPLNEFWRPLLHDQPKVLVCTGGVVFKEGNFSGVETAGKDIEYPFVSSQIASSISLISTLLERNGASPDLKFSASTPITTLREQPLILLGGYNNLWTLRLLENSPFHFSPSANPSIVSNFDPGLHWARDQSLPYSSADDYALIARFRDSTTDSWIVVLAGLGRNGTEAATQFVTSPHYMQAMRDKLGTSLETRNLEAVLKVNVIDGKTGAPSLLAVRAW